MKFSSIPLGLALAAALSLSSSHACAATAQLRALSETEMSGVYGRGLTEPTLSALGALTTQEQGGSAVPASAAGDALSALGALSGDAANGIDRQLAQQRLQGGTTTIQADVKAVQTLATLSSLLAPIGGGLPMLPFPLLFALPALPSLDAINHKH
jgi:hypothetical protein